MSRPLPRRYYRSASPRHRVLLVLVVFVAAVLAATAAVLSLMREGEDLAARAVEANYAEQQRLLALHASARLDDLSDDLDAGVSALRAQPDVDWADPARAGEQVRELWSRHASRDLAGPTVHAAHHHTYPVDRGGTHEHHLAAPSELAALACPVCLSRGGVLPVAVAVDPADPDSPVLEFSLPRADIAERIAAGSRGDSVWWADRKTGTLLASPERRFDGVDLRRAAGDCLPGFEPILTSEAQSGTARYCWPYLDDRRGERLAGWSSTGAFDTGGVVGVSTDRERALAPLAASRKSHRSATTSLAGLSVTLVLFLVLGSGALLRRERAASRAGLVSLSTALEARDRYTRFHSENVGTYAAELGRRLGMSSAEQRELYDAGLLHDIGKIGICDGILLKPGPLDEDERRAVQRHPEVGEQILQELPWAGPICGVAACHHERMDGGGYPRGLVGDEIPRFARVVAVADVFDALLTDRPYRSALPMNDVLGILQQMAGSHLDPEVVEALLLDAEALHDLGKGASLEDQARSWETLRKVVVA